ncbi:MAG: hypothetical protein ACE5IY_06730 [bacterium]
MPVFNHKAFGDPGARIADVIEVRSGMNYQNVSGRASTALWKIRGSRIAVGSEHYPKMKQQLLLYFKN